MLNNKNMSSTQVDIHERIYKFVITIIGLTKTLPKTTQNLILINQIVRSVASIGANATEATAASTKKEFIRCLTISKKEARETEYWLNVIKDTNEENIYEKIIPFLVEIDEIIRIISKIIINSQSKI